MGSRVENRIRPSLKEFFNRMFGNYKEEETTDIAKMDGISEDTRRELLASLARIDKNADVFAEKFYEENASKGKKSKNNLRTQPNQVSVHQEEKVERENGGREIGE